jgi:hypothetical protein
MRHPLRVQILNLLSEEGPMSPKMMTEHVEAGLNLTSYHMRVLHKECKLIEIEKEIPRRGAIEHVFRIKPEAKIGHPDWQKMLPEIMVGDLKAAALRTFVEQLCGAAAAVDPSRLSPDDVLGWVPVRVDNTGRQKIANVLDKTLAQVAKIEAESQEQVQGDPARAVTLAIGITSFEAGSQGLDAVEEEK